MSTLHLGPHSYQPLNINLTRYKPKPNIYVKKTVHHIFTLPRTIYILRQQFHTNFLPYHFVLSSFCHYNCCGLFNYDLLTLTQKRRSRNFSANSMTNIFSSKQAKLCYGAWSQINTHASERNPGFCKHFTMIRFSTSIYCPGGFLLCRSLEMCCPL